ncbi:MAG: hypothetical protein H7Y20_01250 [Bryobacteraceae bacterium]|nr:hypothetical protein [Bryobacteraceae bacterium]
MSCRVIRDPAPLSSHPLFEVDERRASPPKSALWTSGDGGDNNTAGEVERLSAQVRDLQTRLQSTNAEARQAGFAEGETAGYERATASTKPVLEKLAKAIADTSSLRGRIREETEKDLITLAIAVARRILRREITVDPDALQGIVKAAIEKVQTRDITRVRIHSGHEQAVRHCLLACHAAGVELIGEPGLEPGDVIIETKRGNLEASIDTQLAEIERGFADRIGR